MHFKHPEILWFLFLLVIPIIVHLFQLRRFRKEYFTNVRFLKALSIQTRKSSKLKKYLLLATRMLLLAATVIAFAQPYFEAKDKTGAANEMYIILDNSFSMQARGQQGELLRREIENLLAHTPEDVGFSLLTNDEAFWDTDIKSVRRDLQQLPYSATPFNLEAHLAKIRTRTPALGKDVIVITDAAGAQKAATKIDGVNTYVLVPEAESTSNVAIDSVFLEQTLDNFYEIALTLSATQEVRDLPVGLYNNGKLIAKTQTSFAKNTQLKFTIPKEDFHGYASIADKGLAYDNTLFFSLSKPSKVAVMAIGDSGKSAFLAKIYNDPAFDYRQADASNIDYNTLEKQDVIILNEIADISSNLQTALKAFAQKGGNLVVIPSADTDAAKMTNFLGGFGPFRMGAYRPGKQQVTRISFKHPLYSNVFEKQIDNFQYPETIGTFDISGGAAAALAYEDGRPFLAFISLPASSAYVFAAPLNRDHGNFQNSPLIVPTFYNMAQQVSKTGITAVTIGDETPFFADASLGKDAILTVSGARENFIPVQQAMNNKVKMSFEDLPREAGNYRILQDGNAMGNISFNYPRTEGNLKANPDVYGVFESVDDIRRVFDTLKTQRTGTSLWKLFVALALLFLLLEILIQKLVK